MSTQFTELDTILSQATGPVAPTIVCRVEQDGAVLFEGAYGCLNPASQTRPTPVDTIFDLASLTKLFTATAFLRLVDNRQVGLDQPVADIVPEFGGERIVGGSQDPLSKRPVPGDPRWSGQIVDADTITFRHLLTHTGGLPAWHSIYRVCGPVPALQPPSSGDIARRQELALAAIAGYPFVAPPSATYAYSDIGLILLGFAVERIHGSRLDEVIGDLVSQPLDLAVCFNPPLEQQHRIAATEDDPWRQRRLRGEVHDENAAGLGGIAGHAGLFGTAADLCRLGRLYLNGGEDMLSPTLVAESISEVFVSEDGVRRGLGWLLRSDPNPPCSTAFSVRSFGHTGYTGTSLWCDPQRDVVVALLTNRVYNGRDPQNILAFRPQVHRSVADAL